MRTKRRIETKSSRTAEWTCICRAASTLESSLCYRSDDTIALRILPPPIKRLIQIPFYRKLHCRLGAPKGIYEYIIARTKYFDAVYREAIDNRIDQIIVLGAGFDSRAVRFPTTCGRTRIYEFDSRTTQQAKLLVYRKNNVAIPADVRLEAIDFNKELLSQRLEDAGVQRGYQCLFVMEGVSMYLNATSAKDTFLAMTRFMGQGSRVVFDYVPAEVLRHEKNGYGANAIMKTAARVNESWHFGIETGKISEFLSNYSLRLVNHMNPRNMEEAYFKDDQGRLVGRVNDAHCLVTAAK